MMTKERPRNCQALTTDTPTSAHVGFSRMGGWGLIPSQGNSPTTGFISVPNTSAATATPVTTVDEKIVR